MIPIDVDVLLTGGTLVTIDPSRRIIADGAVAVSAGRIVAIGSSDELAAVHRAVETIDCRGKTVLPGLVDAHGHAGHPLIKTLATDSPSLWMQVLTPAYFHFTTPEFWYADGLLAATERVRAGVTCGVSVMGSRPRADDPRFGLEHARATREVGIRDIVAVGPSGLPWPHPVSRWDSGSRVRGAVSLEEMIEGTEAVIEGVRAAQDDRSLAYLTPFTIVPSVDPSNPTPADRATALTTEDRLLARRVRETAAKWQVRIHSDAFGGMIRMAATDPEFALLGQDVHLQHCYGISLEEVGILAETGTSVGHAPGGPAPVAAMLDAGISVAVTTDGHAERPYDLFQAARSVQFAQRIRTGDQYLLPAGRLLEMITIEAARVLGLDNEIGSIEVGKRADLTVVDTRQPHLVPSLMPVHQLIGAAVGHDVDTVLVGGEVVMRDRRVLTVDLDSVLSRAEEESSKLITRAGLQPHLNPPGWGRGRITFDTPLPLPD
jgi:5-methylthioadenosine/S-adenosylhomocysteine deaminase